MVELPVMDELALFRTCRLNLIRSTPVDLHHGEYRKYYYS
jgi:hypothetical protein